MATVACNDSIPERRLTWGQWVWSRTDSTLLATNRQRTPDLEAGVWVATISFRAGTFEQRLALPPSIANAESIAIVVRVEDSVHEAWERLDDAQIGRAMDARLRALLPIVLAGGVHVREVQLDYDCPERRLERWSRVLGDLRDGALAGQTVWVTSLVAHVERPEYGALFRGVIDGHILQVFDTGDAMSPREARRVMKSADAHRIPFRLGIGAFERVLSSGKETRHRAWFSAIPTMAESQWFRGVWVFPGGREWKVERRALSVER